RRAPPAGLRLAAETRPTLQGPQRKPRRLSPERTRCAQSAQFDSSGIHHGGTETRRNHNETQWGHPDNQRNVLHISVPPCLELSETGAAELLAEIGAVERDDAAHFME